MLFILNVVSLVLDSLATVNPIYGPLTFLTWITLMYELLCLQNVGIELNLLDFAASLQFSYLGSSLIYETSRNRAPTTPMFSVDTLHQDPPKPPSRSSGTSAVLSALVPPNPDTATILGIRWTQSSEA